MIKPLKFGLVGTGHWAQVAHAPALAAAEGIEFAAVWGRNHEAASALAASHRVTAHRDLEEFLAAVDGVAFSVPPDVQAEIAPRAARAGKHLLLEKPIATTLAAADALVAAVEEAGVASVVFFTARFHAEVRAWLDRVGGEGPWAGGSAVWLGTAWQDSSPFNTPWRRDKGALWDLAPHAISLLWATLGPVTSVRADAGQADVTHLVLHHAGGVTTTVTVTLSAPPAAEGVDIYLWGEPGRSAAPVQIGTPVPALRTALAELAESAATGRPHPCDARFGRDVVRVIADAQHQIDG
ncbi:MAG TPA: Gfo/Idh/MocA family oxidoreductase [Streptosporangiaceae bacterium]|jgi:predicted dehydrogenase|nr:Gfo/Idh/MocA family oxidoreductase [Streptosporangiaceae bacterium]